MDELLLKYADRFGENFPTFFFRGTPEEEMMGIIQQCLDDGVPFDAEAFDSTDVLY